MVLLGQQTARLVTKENERLRASNTDLLNRVQSEDLRTYHSLSSAKPEEIDYVVIPKTDSGEIKQLQDINGLGEPIYDDTTGTDGEFDDFLRDLGTL